MKNSTIKYYAFFDVDGTLMKGKPMIDFLRFYYKKYHINFPVLGSVRYHIFKIKAALLGLINTSREAQNRLYYKCYKNRSKQYIDGLGCKWFKEFINDHAFIPRIVDELNYHKTKGGEIVLVSGSFPAILNKVADKLGLQHILSTTLEEKNGQYTGNLISDSIIGEGKAVAIRKFLEGQESVDTRNCFAYGDHVSDKEMLSLVGYPVVVAGDNQLETIANNKKWRIVYPNK